MGRAGGGGGREFRFRNFNREEPKNREMGRRSEGSFLRFLAVRSGLKRTEPLGSESFGKVPAKVAKEREIGKRINAPAFLVRSHSSVIGSFKPFRVFRGPRGCRGFNQ